MPMDLVQGGRGPMKYTLKLCSAALETIRRLQEQLLLALREYHQEQLLPILAV